MTPSPRLLIIFLLIITLAGFASAYDSRFIYFDTGDIALNGSNGVHNTNVTAYNWTDNGFAGGRAIYNTSSAYNGSLGLYIYPVSGTESRERKVVTLPSTNWTSEVWFFDDAIGAGETTFLAHEIAGYADSMAIGMMNSIYSYSFCTANIAFDIPRTAGWKKVQIQTITSNDHLGCFTNNINTTCVRSTTACNAIVRHSLYSYISSNTSFDNFYIYQGNITPDYPSIDGGDTTAPTFTVIPNNATLEYKTQSLSVQFNATDETAFANFSINDTTNFQITNNGLLTNKTNLAIANYTINVSINDTSGNTNSTLYYVYVQDTTFPTIDWGIGTTTNGTTISQSWIYMNTSWTELNFSNITFWVDSTSVTNTSQIYSYNATGLSDGSHTFYTKLCDGSGNCNQTSTRNTTLDKTAPSITLISPTNGSNINLAVTSNIWINVSCNEQCNITINDTRWSLNSNTSTQFNFLNNTNLSDGQYQINITVKDVLNQSNSTILDFVLDTITPAITWYSSRNSITNTPTFKLNATIIDTYLDAVNVTLICANGTEMYNNYSANINVTTQWITDSINISQCGDGNHTINIAGRDSLTHSPSLKNYGSAMKSIDIVEYADVDININYSLTYKLMKDINNNPYNLVNKNFNYSIVDDGEHITTSWCIDAPQKTDDYVEMIFTANSPTTKFYKKDKDGIGHFTISNEKYYTHRKYWSEGFNVSYQSFTENQVVMMITGNWSLLVQKGRLCTNSGITGGLNINSENSSVYYDTAVPTFATHIVTPTFLENTTGNVVIKINVTNPVDNLSQVYINWTTNYTINYSQYITGVYNASPTYSRNMTFESKTGNISTYNVTINFSLINPNIDYVYATPYNFTFNFTFYAIDVTGNTNSTKQLQKIQYDNDAPSSTSTISPILGQDIIYSSGFTADWYDANESDGHQILYNIELFKDSISFRNVTNLTSSTYTTGSLEIGSWYYTIESCDNPNYLNYSNDTRLCASKITSPTFELYTETPSSSGGGGGSVRTSYDYTTNIEECKYTLSQNSIKITSLDDKINFTLINNENRKMDYEFAIIDITGKETIKEYIMFTKDQTYLYAGKSMGLELSLDTQRLPLNTTITGGAMLEIRPYKCKKIEIPIDVAIMSGNTIDGTINQFKDFANDYVIDPIKQNPVIAVAFAIAMLVVGGIGLMLL